MTSDSRRSLSVARRSCTVRLSRPLQFRLDASTRRRGLAFIAQIRREAASRQAQRAAAQAA